MAYVHRFETTSQERARDREERERIATATRHARLAAEALLGIPTETLAQHSAFEALDQEISRLEEVASAVLAAKKAVRP